MLYSLSMKIVFTGGGTGGHFYPLIAIAEAVRGVVAEQHLVAPRLYYLAPTKFDEEALFGEGMEFVAIPAGKWRRYASVENYTDLFITFWGYLCALLALMRIYPDVVVSKGGFASVPTVLAAATLGIPVIIHESDAKPGRANLWLSRFAYRVAVSFDGTAAHFPAKIRPKIAKTGVPVRAGLAYPEVEGAAETLGLEPGIPTILILGGSSGSGRINDIILESLPELVSFANVIHQTGKQHFPEIERTAKLILEKSEAAHRYHPFPYLSMLTLRRAAGAASLIISRSGATAIAEIALWKRPAILIPIPESVSHDQRENAYAYAHTGAAAVLEEGNLTPHVLVSEAKRITSDAALAARMAEAGSAFQNAGAARIIAEEAVRIMLEHEEKNV